ncbi:MAG: reverse transcriptase domain-containing protein, partial [Candidatus Fonsibacter sp.]
MKNCHDSIYFPEVTVCLDPATMGELASVIARMRRHRAAGPDGIPAELWKWLDDGNRAILLDLVNSVLFTGRIPTEWARAEVVEIYKGKGDPKDPSSYRPISLLSTAYKLLAALLHKRLEAEIEDRLIHTQYGFRKGRS